MTTSGFDSSDRCLLHGIGCGRWNIYWSIARRFFRRYTAEALSNGLYKYIRRWIFIPSGKKFINFAKCMFINLIVGPAIGGGEASVYWF
jgi:hypothetical protein